MEKLHFYLFWMMLISPASYALQDSEEIQNSMETWLKSKETQRGELKMLEALHQEFIQLKHQLNGLSVSVDKISQRADLIRSLENDRTVVHWLERAVIDVKKEVREIAIKCQTTPPEAQLLPVTKPHRSTSRSRNHHHHLRGCKGHWQDQLDSIREDLESIRNQNSISSSLDSVVTNLRTLEQGLHSLKNKTTALEGGLLEQSQDLSQLNSTVSMLWSAKDQMKEWLDQTQIQTLKDKNSIETSQVKMLAMLEDLLKKP